jgi:hypothetical protein
MMGRRWTRGLPPGPCIVDVRTRFTRDIPGELVHGIRRVRIPVVVGHALRPRETTRVAAVAPVDVEWARIPIPRRLPRSWPEGASRLPATGW